MITIPRTLKLLNMTTITYTINITHVSPLLVLRLDARVCGGSCFRGHRGMTGRNFVRCWLRSFKGMMHGTASRTNVVYTSAFCA